MPKQFKKHFYEEKIDFLDISENLLLKLTRIEQYKHIGTL